MGEAPHHNLAKMVCSTAGVHVASQKYGGVIRKTQKTKAPAMPALLFLLLHIKIRCYTIKVMKSEVKTTTKKTYILGQTPRKRLLVWKSVKGIWKKRIPEPISELANMRKEWVR